MSVQLAGIRAQHEDVLFDDTSETRRFHVRVTLMTLKDDILNDPDGSKLLGIVERVSKNCRRAIDFNAESSSARPGDAGKQLTIDVTKFLQLKDKYAALASTLLKSMAFHRVYVLESTCDEPVVVMLPRTANRKPYIPPLSIAESSCHAGIDPAIDETIFPVSVSHQNPFAGIAQFIPAEEPASRRPQLRLGMDIVAFDPFNPRLYKSNTEFVKVFQSSFTTSEWMRIHAPGRSILHEFYLRWAMKEAYTKALGLGMGLDFSSFDITVHGVDDVDTEGIWQYVCPNWESGIVASCSVETKSRQPETWAFFFMPLFDSKSAFVHKESSGCCCACFGPEDSYTGDLAKQLRVSVSWKSIYGVADSSTISSR